MDRESFILPAILIVVVVIILALIIAYSGSNTFEMGKVSFQYPGGWSQNSPVGNFSNGSLYSEVTFTANYADSNGVSQPSYIVIQMQQRVQGTLNLPSTSSIVANTTNSSVSSLTVSNFTATQLGSFGTNVVEKNTIIQQGNYYLVITSICPPYAANQTSSAYNMILQTLKIG